MIKYLIKISLNIKSEKIKNLQLERDRLKLLPRLLRDHL